MQRALHILLVEDSEDDALLLERVLRRSGYAPEITRVDSPARLRQALTEPGWDVVITDHNLPGFSSEASLKMVREAELDIPVIIVSGSIGEDIAVAAMKMGASDYIMKGNLARLAPAIERELRETKLRREHRKAEATIRHMAFHDPLTGLFNRHHFEQRVAEALREVREGGVGHALLYLDLDQFKVVNDTCGHVAGDELLRQLSMLLHSQVRESDILARLGGDEFGVLLESCPGDRAEQIAGKLLQAINQFRFSWCGKTFAVGGSIGLVPITTPNADVSDLLRSADIACYAAKDHGRNRVHVYSEDDLDLLRRQGEMQWVSRINAALEEGRFVLYRQNIVPLKTGNGSAECCEMLIRMRDEDGNVVLPGAFFPAAERYNLAPAIDRWVVRNLLQAVAKARELAIPTPNSFFINISGTTLNDDAFFDFVREQLAETRLPASNLCFEITETAAIANLSRAVAFIEHFRREGCHFALDDFGAGLSSFSYLKTIPVDYLKIDGHFVKNILDNAMDRAIVEAINQIGHVVGLKTIAEFVESEAIRRQLCEIGADYAQGFGLHRPEPMGNCFADWVPSI
jgi:diguanylate cyclase (GGDEF)-like protein